MQVPGWCVGKDRVFWHPSEGSPLTSLPIVQLNPVPSVSFQLSHMQTEPSQSPAQSHEAPRTIDDRARKAKSRDLGLDFSLRWVWRTNSHQIWFTLVQAGLERAWGSEVCVDLPGRSSHARVCKYTRAPAPTHPFLSVPSSLSRPKTCLSCLVEKMLVPQCSSISWRCACDELWMIWHIWNHKEIQFKFPQAVQSPFFICPSLTSIVHCSRFCRGMSNKCWSFASSGYWLILFVAFHRDRFLLVFHSPLSVCVSLCVFNIQKQ